jgi:hypothetical protein
MDTDVIIDIGDTHVGHRLALTPPRGFVLDGGTVCRPNPIQAAINEAWARFCQRVRDVTKGKTYTLIHKGDVVEGVHHKASDALSINMTDQQNNAVDVLRELAADAAEVYFCRGTPAHAGQDSCFEEFVAQAVGAIPNGAGQYTRQVLDLRWHGLVIHAAHHIGTTGVHGGKATAPMAELAELRATAGQWGLRAPDIITRGHRHDAVVVGTPSRRGMAWSIATPGWQGKTGFAYKVRGGRVGQLHVGGGIHEFRGGRFLPWIESYAIAPELPVEGGEDEQE